MNFYIFLKISCGRFVREDGSAPLWALSREGPTWATARHHVESMELWAVLCEGLLKPSHNLDVSLPPIVWHSSHPRDGAFQCLPQSAFCEQLYTFHLQ